MTLEETTQLYASVLRQLLPTGGYDTSPNTEALAVDVYAHAKLLAQADLDAKRLLKVLEELPSELLPEYETEYGLPLKCTVNAGKTLEERIELLKWVRSTRNVLNKAYLEQILAIFGVVLIDIVKFKPMKCTAPCNAPVNTEQLRYKVLLELQYPVDADINCIIENYLPCYLRIDLLIDMPWGDWILNATVIVNNTGFAHYTAFKTNQRKYYDSYANFDLTNAITLSFSDLEMQRLQAVSDAISAVEPTAIDYSINESDLVFNIQKQPENVTTDEIVNVITERYTASPLVFVGKEQFQTLITMSGWTINGTGQIMKPDAIDPETLLPSEKYGYAVAGVCYSLLRAQKEYVKNYFPGWYYSSTVSANIYPGGVTCTIIMTNYNPKYGPMEQSLPLGEIANPNYDPNFKPGESEAKNQEIHDALKNIFESNDTEIGRLVAELTDSVFSYDAIAGSNSLYESTLSVKSFTELSQQIISNAQSDNHAISLFAEAYLENVAQSIFNADQLKQFVKQADLLSQFELNKTLRT
jgi:uncharacterized protein YmfQ (DUF2313 family)